VFPFNPKSQHLVGQPARIALNAAQTVRGGLPRLNNSTFNSRGFNRFVLNASEGIRVVRGLARPNVATFNSRAFNGIAFNGSTPPVLIVTRAGLALRNTSAFNSRGFNAVAFGGTNGVILSLRQAVNAWLRSIPGLTAVVGTRIYKEDPSQMSLYPCLAVELPTRSYGHNLAGADGTSLATLKFTAYSLLESSAVAAIEAIRNNADGFRGIQSGVPILRCFLDEEEDDTVPPPDGSDQWIYSASVTYLIKHRVPTPTSVTQTNV
jgi:hypothetical protein